MNCPFCDDDIDQFDGEQIGHVSAAAKKVSDNGELHVHVHGSIEDPTLMMHLIDAIIKESNLGHMYKKQKSGE